MNIDRETPSAVELSLLYKDAGWIEDPAPEKMEKALDHDSLWFVARNSDGAILGAGRIITDYARYAFIVDVIVLEACQGEGIGTRLMDAILTECHDLNIDSVNLWPSKGKVPFYERFGFYALPPDQPHMKWKGR